MAPFQRFHSIALGPAAAQSIIVEHVCWARLVTANRKKHVSTPNVKSFFPIPGHA